MVNGVVHQIGNRAAQLLFVAHHLERFVDAKVQLMLTLAEGLRLALNHPQHHRDVDFIIHRQHRRGFNTRERQQLLHQPFHPLRLLTHGVQRFFPRRPFQHLLLHHLEITLQYGERRAQLVADVGEKVAPRAFQLVHLRDIARHHQPLFIAIRHHANFQMTGIIEHQIKGLGEIAVFQIVSKLWVAQQVEDILPAIVRPA